MTKVSIFDWVKISGATFKGQGQGSRGQGSQPGAVIIVVGLGHVRQGEVPRERRPKGGEHEGQGQAAEPDGPRGRSPQRQDGSRKASDSSAHWL